MPEPFNSKTLKHVFDKKAQRKKMMHKKLLTALIILHTLATEAKFISLFKKEKVVITFQQDDSQKKDAQEKVDKFFLNNKPASQKEEPAKTVFRKDFEEKTNPSDSTIIQMIHIQEDITISEMFDMFSNLLKKVSGNIFENQSIKAFFIDYGPVLLLKIPELCGKSCNDKKDKEKLSILISFYICTEYNKYVFSLKTQYVSLLKTESASNMDLLIKKIKAVIPEPFSSIYFEKMIQSQIKTLKRNKQLKAICSYATILLLQKQLEFVKQWVQQSQNYSYEKKMAEKQTVFSTKFLAHRYNQLPASLDRTTLKYFNTQSGKPQHEIYYEMSYAKK